MSTAALKRISEAEYLDRERLAVEKSEYFDGEIFAMAGASFAHNQIGGNLYLALRLRLNGKPCQPLMSDMRIHIPQRRKFTYPDISVVCGKPEFSPGPSDNLLNPRVIFEVLSPSTEAYDRSAKFRHYQAIESLAEYVLVEQDSADIDCFTRAGDDAWILRSYSGLDAVLSLNSIDCQLPLAEIYTGVEFPPVSLRDRIPDDPAV
jgi:Uma2 family endonuclease